MRRFFTVSAVLFMAVAAARAYTNILENGTNQTVISGYDAGGDLIVGDATSSNVLFVLGDGSLTNADAYVGRQAAASDNTATVSGAGAEWLSTGALRVGAAGNSNNSVSVSSGGSVTADNLIIGSGNAFNLNTGGMLVLASGFDVSANGFQWNNGSTLSVGGMLTGLATNEEGTVLSGGKTLVLNGGSLDSAADLMVGFESSDNTLAITNGAAVGSVDGYIGWGPDSADNLVLVSGAGSTWTNSGNLYVGVYGDATNLMTAGSGNSLVVTNGGWVLTGGLDTNLTAMGSGGMAVAGGSGVVVGNTADVVAEGVFIDAAGTFDLDGSLRVTGDFDADQAGFKWNDGSTLTVNRALILNANLGGTNKNLNVDGGAWNRGADLTLDGSGNKLAVLNGGAVTNDAGFVAGTGNTVTVSGSGSSWVNNGTLDIDGTENNVTVNSGGTVHADALTIAGGNEFNLNNGGTLAVAGGFDLAVQTNVNWNSGGNLSVGGLLEGMAVVNNLPAADADYLSGGKVLTLAGGQWLPGENNLIVGFDNDLNRMVIANGGRVENADGYIGWGNSADLNSVIVNAGGTWANNGGGLYVGAYLDANTNRVNAGKENSLTVNRDGWVYVGEGRIAGPGGGLVVASTNGAELVVGGKSSSVTVEQGLYVGVDSTSAGTVDVVDGGTVSVGGLTIAADSTFNLHGTLSVTTNFNAGQDGFIWNDGGSLAVSGDLTGLDTLNGTNKTLTIDAGTWDTGPTNLYITGVGNTLAVTNGGFVQNASAFIGVTSNDVDNTVRVEGAGSEWNLTEDLFINPNNTLALASTGLVSVAGHMSISNAAVVGSGQVIFTGAAGRLSIYGTGSRISTNVLFDGGGGGDTAVAVTDGELMVTGSLTNRFTGFESLNLTNSLLGGTGHVDAFGSIGMSGGRVSPDGELVIDSPFDASGTLLQLTAGADRLVFTNSAAPRDLSGLLAEVTVSDTNTFREVIVTSDSGFSAGFASTNFIEPFLLYNFMLTDDGTNVSVESETVQDGEIGATLAYGGIQGVRSGFNGMQNTLFVRTKQLRRNTVATDDAISNEAYLMSQTNAPSGPPGPGDKNTVFGMHFWAKQYSGQGDYDASGASDGFSLNNNGTTFGFDRLFGDALVAGINYTYARSAARTGDDDRIDTETYWLGLYGEWFSSSEYYLEGLIGCGWSDYDTRRNEAGYVGEGKFEGTDVGAHIEAGKYLHRGSWAMAPYAGLQYLAIESDAYTETERGSGADIKVNGQNVDSLESVLGVKLRNRIDTQAGRFQIAGYAEWVYDFISDDIESTLSDGTVSVDTARIAPGEHLINTGIGLSWICTEYLDVGIGYDGRFNADYEEHTGSAMLEVRF